VIKNRSIWDRDKIENKSIVFNQLREH